jgi:hypothetical protein
MHTWYTKNKMARGCQQGHHIFGKQDIGGQPHWIWMTVGGGWWGPDFRSIIVPKMMIVVVVLEVKADKIKCSVSVHLSSPEHIII